MPTVTAEAGDGYVRLSWDDVAERGVDPVTERERLRGLPHLPRDRPRVPRSAGHRHRQPAPDRSATASRSPSSTWSTASAATRTQAVEGVAYYLGNDTGITHTWTDTTVTNGQQYYYAVTRLRLRLRAGGSTRGVLSRPRTRSPSRARRAAASSCRRTWSRCGPSPRVPGYVRGERGRRPTHVAGRRHRHGARRGRELEPGAGRPPLPARLPHRVAGQRARRLRTRCATARRTTTLFSTRARLRRAWASARSAAGLLPVVQTHEDSSTRTARPPASRAGSADERAPRGRTTPARCRSNRRRVGFPDDLAIVFADAVRGHRPSTLGRHPARRRRSSGSIARTPDGDVQAATSASATCDGDGTLDPLGECIDVVTYLPGDAASTRSSTWRVQLDPRGAAGRPDVVPPARATSTTCDLTRPFGGRRRLRLHAPAASAWTPAGARGRPRKPVRRAESVRRLGQLRAGALRGLGPRRAAHRVPRPAAELHDPDLHGARRPGADAAARRLARRLRGLGPADQGQPGRRARACTSTTSTRRASGEYIGKFAVIK